LAAAAVAGLLAAGCTGDSAATPPATSAGPGSLLGSDQLTFVAALRTIGDCDAVLDHLKTEAAARVGPYGLGGAYGFAVDSGRLTSRSAAAAGAAGTVTTPAEAPAAAPTPGGAADYSTTNVQEAGVDEPDIVKSDGDHIITLTDGVLSVVDARAATPTVVGRVQLATDRAQPQELLVAGTKALVIGNAWDAGRGGPVPAAGPAGAKLAPPIGRPRATLTEVDLADPTAPAVGATLQVDGGYLSGRLVGATARIVVRSEPSDLAFVFPQSAAGEERAKRANQQVVAESTLADWLPSYTLVGVDGAIRADGILTDCDRVDAPTEFAGFGSLSVLTFDLTAPLGDGDAMTVLASGETVYASASTLYVATTSYVDPTAQQDGSRLPRLERDFSTSIHAFDIGGTAPPTYAASGTVRGHRLDQFALREHDGLLRAATTKGTPWGGGDATSESVITVLEPQGRTLATIGSVGDMGKGERIYSVRYAADVAYVVTFRQTDPFYTVDLTDPRAPKVVGELKIPGYSGYLHPIGDDLVIGVGQDASDQGRVRGTKVSLFDVRDLAAPRELDTWVVPNSQSGAEWDHRAFLWWPASRSVVLPLNDPGHGFYGAVVLTVDRASGIEEAGRVEHAGPAGPKAPGVIQRSLVVGPNLWTLAPATLQANALAGLAPHATLSLR
jgi:hypothetical protein